MKQENQENKKSKKRYLVVISVIVCILALACVSIILGSRTKTPAVSEEAVEGVFKEGITYESFTDVATHSANDYIKVMTKLGIVRGRSDTAYEPDAAVTTAEFAEMMAALSGLTEEELLADVSTDKEAAISREGILAMTAKGYRKLTGSEADDTLLTTLVGEEVQESMTRADAAVMLYELQNYAPKLISAGFDEGISDWGTKIRTGATATGYENGAGEALWSAEGNAAPGSLLFDMSYTGKKQTNAFQWDYTIGSEDGNIIEEGVTYMVTLFAKIEGAEKVNLNVVKLRHENDNDINYSTIVDSRELTGEGWRLYCFELTATTSIDEVKLLFQAGGCENHNTKIYIDDISMQQYEAKVNVKAEVEGDYEEFAKVSGVGTYGPYEEATLMAAGKKVENIKEGNWIQEIKNFFLRLFGKTENDYYLADHWTETTYGNVVAQGSAYEFTVEAPTTVKVNYQKYDVQEKDWELPVSGKSPKVSLKSVDGGKKGVTVSARIQLSEGYTLADCGALYYEGTYAENYNIFTKGVKVVSAAEVTDKGGFEVTKDGLASDKDVLTKAYAILKDADGNYLVLYSEENVCQSSEKRAEIDYNLIYNIELMNCFKNDFASEEGGYDAAWSEYISQLVDTDVDLVTLTPSTYRSNLWPSKVDTHWTEYAPTQEETDFAIYERGKEYILGGGDPLQEMLDYCEEYQIESVFVNYRMNDDHNTDKEDFATHNQFYIEHPEYWLNPTSTSSNRTLNYMEPEVRDYYFGLVEELVTNYDVDGLELDFERAPIFFKDEEIEAGTQVMTDFVGRVRAMLDRVGEEKGKYLPLSVRVCDSLEESLSVGLDVAAWDALGYIDIVNTTSSYRHTMALNVETYTETLGDNVKVYAEMEYLVDQSTTDTSQRVYTTAECLKATAESYYARGVDGISAFNMDYSLNKEKTLSGLKGITDAEVLKNSEKHYVLLNGYDYAGKDGVYTATPIMPVDNTLYDSGLIRVEAKTNIRNTTLEVYVNGTKLEMPGKVYLTDDTELFPRLADTTAYAKAECLQYFTLPVELVQNGENTIEVKYVSGTECVVKEIEVALYHKDSYALQGEGRDPRTIKSNLIANGTFENGDSSWTTDIKEKLKASGSVSYPESGGVKDSAYVLFDIKNGGTAGGAVQLYQTMKTVNITAGKTYRLTFSAKVNGKASLDIEQIWLRNIKGDALTLGSVKNVTVSGSTWKTYTYDILAVESSEGSRLLFNLGGENSSGVKLGLDNISLIELDGITSVQEEQVNPNSLLINGGFGKLGASWTAVNKIGTYEWLTKGGIDNSSYLLYNITSSSIGKGTQIGDLQLYQILKDVQVEAGYTYRFTFHAKVEGTDSMSLGKIWIRNNETTGVTLGEVKQVAIAGSEWTSYSVDIPVTTSSNGIRMMLQMGGGVTVPDGTTVKLSLDHLCLMNYGKTPTTGENGGTGEGGSGEGESGSQEPDEIETVGEDSLLTNGGFGKGGDSWNAETNTVVATYEWMANGGVDNSNCLRYNITSTSSGTEKQIKDFELTQVLKDIKVEAGKTYNFTFYAKLVGADNMKLGRIWIRNAGTTSVALGEVKQVPVAGSEWTSYSVDIKVDTSSDGIHMKLQMGGGVTVPEGGTVQLYLDHLCLKEKVTEIVYKNELANNNMDTNNKTWRPTVDQRYGPVGTAGYYESQGIDGSGCYGFEITNAGTTVNAIYLFQNMSSLTVTSGETYKLTFWAKLENADSWKFGDVWLRNINDNKHLEETAGVITVSGTGWNKYEINFTIETACDGVRLVMNIGNGLTVPPDTTVKLYLDDFELIKTGEAPATAAVASELVAVAAVSEPATTATTSTPVAWAVNFARFVCDIPRLCSQKWGLI